MRAMRDIVECRTESLGGHVFECDQCATLHYAYHSCRNRHCPKCDAKSTARWLDKCRQSLLPVRYFHIVFTLPRELREIVRMHQKVLLSVLCQAAAHSLMKLALDPRYVGDKIGVLAVVHTWTRAMIYHPHVHMLATGGGVSPDGARFLFARRGFLVPVKALSPIFRAKFVELARKALPQLKFPQSIWNKNWVVYGKSTLHGVEKVVSYLARYIHRVAITNRRIISIEDGKVQFRYKDSREKIWKTMLLPASEFIRRFLQHVLPQGFHKVRYYGILAPSNRHLLSKAKAILEDSTGNQSGSDEHESKDAPCIHNEPKRCPSCKKGVLIFIGTVPRKGRSPP